MVVGIGLSSAATADELANLVAEALAAAGVAPRHVALLATLDTKVAAVEELRPDPAWPVLGFRSDTLAEVEVPSPAAGVAAHVGTPSVAEAAALLGAAHLADHPAEHPAAPPARLLCTKRTSPHATAAVAVAVARAAAST